MPPSWGMGNALGFRANKKIHALGPILLASHYISYENTFTDEIFSVDSLYISGE
jgi:hypothetical protein